MRSLVPPCEAPRDDRSQSAQAAPASTAQHRLPQQRLRVLIHKACQQIAREHGGVAMYEALIARCADQQPPEPSAELALLLAFREDRIAHLGVLERVVERLCTESNDLQFAPCAARAATEAVQSIREAAGPITQSLQALLAAELIDVDCWSWLETAARQSGHPDVADAFGSAGADQARHRRQLRSWYVQWTTA